MLRRLLLASLLCACGSHHGEPSVPHGAPAAVAKLPEGPPLVTPGEHMTYKLSLVGAELATYEVAIGEATTVAGKQAIVVQSHAKVSGLGALAAGAAGVHVDDYFTSWLDVATGRPLRWSCDEYATKSDDKERTDARLAERAGDIVPMDFHLNDDPPQTEPQKVSLPDVWDFNAFLVALRSWEGRPGTSVIAEVLRSRYLWHVEMRIHGKERLDTQLGELPALRFDGHTFKLGRDDNRFPDSDERDFSIWISDDDGRVPLRVTAKTDYGDIQLEIIDYQPGSGQRLRN